LCASKGNNTEFLICTRFLSLNLSVCYHFFPFFLSTERIDKNIIFLSLLSVERNEDEMESNEKIIMERNDKK
jgi:hypothetical protein